MRRILLLSLLTGCEESTQHREARIERERRFARGDCLHVLVQGECTSVVGLCPSGDISATYHCASDEVVVVCPEDMPPMPLPERGSTQDVVPR